MRLLLSVFVLLLSTLARADDTWVVTNTGDSGSGSLRGAITQMKPNNGTQTIRFELPAHSVITLTSGLPNLVGASIVLDGRPSPGLRIDALGFPMFNIASGSASQTVIVYQLRLARGASYQGSGCLNLTSTGSMQVFDSVFEACASYGPVSSGVGGGAIRSNGPLRVVRSQFLGNYATDGDLGGLAVGGGAIQAFNANVLIERSRFIGNQTRVASSSPTVCRGGQGAAVSITLPAGSYAALSDVQFIDNATVCSTTGARNAGTGGALAVTGQGPTSTVNLDRAYFGRNEAFEAGAVAAFSVRLSVVNASFFENTAYSSGAMYLLTRTGAPATSLALRNSSFSRNGSSFGSAGADLTLQNGATVEDVRNTVFAVSVSGPNCSPVAADATAGDAVFTASFSCFFYRVGSGDSISSEFPGNTFGLTAATQRYGAVPALHPPAGSVLIDNGTNSGCAAVDTRQFARPANGGLATRCDVGAIEFNVDRLYGASFDL